MMFGPSENVKYPLNLILDFGRILLDFGSTNLLQLIPEKSNECRNMLEIRGYGTTSVGCGTTNAYAGVGIGLKGDSTIWQKRQ